MACREEIPKKLETRTATLCVFMLILCIYELFHDNLHYQYIITSFLFIALSENLFVSPNYQNT